MERWPSGRRRTPGKCVTPNRVRGFESHPLRQTLGKFSLVWVSSGAWCLGRRRASTDCMTGWRIHATSVGICRTTAAHLVGFAAECAIKYRIETLRPAAGAPHGHFPDLIDIARKHLRTRRDTALHNILKQPQLMDGWDVSLRYEGDAVSVLDRLFPIWLSGSR